MRHRTGPDRHHQSRTGTPAVRVRKPSPPSRGAVFEKKTPILFLARRSVAEIDLHARTHGRADRDLLDVSALRARRLRLHDRIDERLDVVLQLLLREAGLADAGLDDAGLLDTELHFTGLGILHRGLDVGGD